MSTDVGSLLREARLSARLTQVEVAERAATSQPAVASYEGGKRTPGLATLARLLSACGKELAIETRTAPTKTQPRSTRELLRTRRSRLIDSAGEHGVKSVRVFGSTARGDESAASDIDLLVDLEPGRTLIDLAAFREDAAGILGVSVDVATVDLLKSHVRDSVLKEARAI